jgi:hypothetical protein
MPLHVSSTMCSSSGGQNCIIQPLVSSRLQVWWYQITKINKILGSQEGINSHYCLPWYDAMYRGTQHKIFGRTCWEVLQWYCTIRCSETSMATYQTTRRHIWCATVSVTLKEGKHQGRTARALRTLQTDNKGKTALCRWPSGARDGHLQSVMIPDAV